MQSEVFFAIRAEVCSTLSPVTLNLVVDWRALGESLLQKWTSRLSDKTPSTRKTQTDILRPLADSGWPRVVLSPRDGQFLLSPESVRIHLKKHIAETADLQCPSPLWKTSRTDSGTSHHTSATARKLKHQIINPSTYACSAVTAPEWPKDPAGHPELTMNR